MNAAFKEWAVICEALGSGQQSVLIRKGGIAEGRAGFAFQHGEFFLFPTWFHEQVAKTTLPADTVLAEQPAEELEIRFSASVEWSHLVTDWELVRQLREFHILQDSVVEERFRYNDTEGVHVAFVRIYRLEPPLRLKNEKKYGGCRSWVEFPEADPAMVSVLSDEEHEKRRAALKKLLGL